MSKKVLIAGDLHKRMVDISTIHGYTKVNTEIQMDLMDIIKQEEIDYFISIGDWFDTGYGSDVSAALAHTDIDREMAKLLNGNFYGLIGNHIRIRLDSNPELFLIQPHPVYKSRHDVIRKDQILRTPDDLIINGVQFCFMHWNKDEENALSYKARINRDCHYHIGLYHTDTIVPPHILERMNMGPMIVSDNSMIGVALDDIELAICGHIHKPMDPFTINHANGNRTLMLIPGSLTNVDAGEFSRHASIDMPLIEIEDDGKMSLRYKTIDLRTSELTFEKKEVSDDTRKKLHSLRGNTKESLYDDMESTTFIGETTAFVSLNAFMRQQQYTDADKAMIRSVMHNPHDIDTLVDLYKGDVVCQD